MFGIAWARQDYPPALRGLDPPSALPRVAITEAPMFVLVNGDTAMIRVLIAERVFKVALALSVMPSKATLW